MLIANPPYMGIKTFLQVPYSPDLSKSPKVAILGIPYDLNVTNRPGARFAPEAIRKASTLLCEGFQGEEVLDFGDILNGLKNTPQETFEEITNYLTRVLEKKIIPVSIGGDHSITLPILRAMAKHYKQPIPLVHFDAHPDTWEENWGMNSGHGSFLFHAIKENLIDGANSFLIGIRCPLDSKTWEFTKKHIKHVYSANDIHEKGLQPLLEDLNSLKGKNAYLTFDIDALDPAYAPGTGTPEVGGLTPWQVKKIFNAPIMREIQWKGMDLVELSPPYDHAEISAVAAAYIIYHFINILTYKEDRFPFRFY